MGMYAIIIETFRMESIVPGYNLGVEQAHVKIPVFEVIEKR
jgi:hypothetical protein